jgi:hypothetical protein
MPVTDTNYASLWNVTALASQGFGLEDKGMHQKDEVAELTEFETNLNAVLTKLDNDGGVSDVNYNTLYAVDLDNTVVGSLGIDMGKRVGFLDDYLANFNLTLTKLDNDGGVADTDYNSTLALTDVINNGVDYTIAANANLAIDDRGYNLGALYTLYNNIVTNFNALNAKLDADS